MRPIPRQPDVSEHDEHRRMHGKQAAQGIRHVVGRDHPGLQLFAVEVGRNSEFGRRRADVNRGDKQLNQTPRNGGIPLGPVGHFRRNSLAPEPRTANPVVDRPHGSALRKAKQEQQMPGDHRVLVHRADDVEHVEIDVRQGAYDERSPCAPTDAGSNQREDRDRAQRNGNGARRIRHPRMRPVGIPQGDWGAVGRKQLPCEVPARHHHEEQREADQNSREGNAVGRFPRKKEVANLRQETRRRTARRERVRRNRRKHHVGRCHGGRRDTGDRHAFRATGGRRTRGGCFKRAHQSAPASAGPLGKRPAGWTSKSCLAACHSASGAPMERTDEGS